MQFLELLNEDDDLKEKPKRETEKQQNFLWLHSATPCLDGAFSGILQLETSPVKCQQQQQKDEERRKMKGEKNFQNLICVCVQAEMFKKRC